jgi:hypothetical protein
VFPLLCLVPPSPGEDLDRGQTIDTHTPSHTLLRGGCRIRTHGIALPVSIVEEDLIVVNGLPDSATIQFVL